MSHKDQLRKLLKSKKSNSVYAKKLGISVEEVIRLKEELKGCDSKDRSFSEDLKNKSAELSFKTYTEVYDLQDLITKAKIDTEKWEITKYVQNYWGNNNDPHYQVKVWLSPKQVKESEVIEKLLTNYKSTYVPLSAKDILTNTAFSSKNMVEISLTDFHLDKLDITNETVEQRIEQFNSTLDSLIYRCYHSFNIEQIVFVIGNDFYNTDNYHNTTTNGTPQRVSMTWDNAYEVGFDLMVKAISKLKQFCETLHIKLVQGNHDKQKSFYMAHALEMYFKADKNIIFDRTSSPRKIHIYGNTLIGYHHGNCKLEALPLIMATEFRKEWGSTKYSVIMTGDKHHFMEKEIAGVRVKQLPSLSGTDEWHNQSNYVGSIRAGIAMVYSYEHGRIAEFEHRI